MPEVKRYPTVVLNIDDIVPYWRNPRRVTDDAVNAVACSIQEFGYKQPIVVDTSNVIIIGHTRYAALRRLGVTEVPVKVAAGLSVNQAKQLRVIDNRTSELTSWDFEALTREIEDLDSELLTAFFPDVVVGEEPLDAPATAEGRSWEEVVPAVQFVCVHCFHSFELVVTREDLLSGKVLRAPGEVVAS